MADIFFPTDLAKLLSNKHVVFLGGSVVRGFYRDMVWLCNTASLIPYEVLGSKGDKHFPDLENTVWKKGKEVSKAVSEIFHKDNRDTLLEYKGLTPGRNYIEPRKYHNKDHNITLVYRFISRVWSDDLAAWLADYKESFGAPIDILLINSCLWDINRWGPTGPTDFKKNMSTLVSEVPGILAQGGHCIWLTSPPGSKELDSKGMNVPGLDFQCLTTQANVVEANWAAARIAARGSVSVLDIHYYLQTQTSQRNRDGIHWSPSVNRLVTNMILTHLVLYQKGPSSLPGRVSDNYSLELAKLRAEGAKRNVDKTELEKKMLSLNKLIRKPVKKTTVDGKGVQIRAILEKMRESVEGRSKLEEFRSRVLSFRQTRGIKRKLAQSPPRTAPEDSFNMYDSYYAEDFYEIDEMFPFACFPQNDDSAHLDESQISNPMYNRPVSLQSNCFNAGNGPNNSHMAKLLYMRKVRQLLSNGWQPTPDDLDCIKKEVRMEMMNNTSNHFGQNNGMGGEFQFPNGQNFMSFGQRGMNMGQNGMNFGHMGEGMNMSMGIGQFGMGPYQTGMGFAQNGLGIRGFGHQVQQQEMSDENTCFGEVTDGLFVRR